MKSLVLWCLLLCPTLSFAERRALIVSNSTGRIDQPTLRFVGADASRMSAVLVEGGEFATPRHVQDGARAEVLSALNSLASEKPFELFLFYYSGHGDAGGLWLGESYLPTDEMMSAIAKVPADLRIVVLDACQSGGAAVRKGVTLAPPVEVRIDHLSSEGNVLIASSSVDEASFESQTLQGAVFSLQFVSGLRGAADEDDDGRVTLSEAYRYAAVHTLRATLLSSTGPQRPNFKWDFTGRSEPVLTHFGQAARLTVRSTSGGSYFVFDGAEQQLLAELELLTGQSARVMLKPGSYVIRGRGEREVRTARFELSANDDRVLDDSKMESAPFVRLARKGAFGQFATSLSAGPAFVTVGLMPVFAMQLSLELQRSWVLYVVDASFLTGAVERFGLTARQTGGGFSAGVMPGLNIGRVTLRLGPTLGLLVLEQNVTARANRVGSMFRAGLRVRAEIELRSGLALTLGAEPSLLLGQFDGRWYPELIANAFMGLRLEL